MKTLCIHTIAAVKYCQEKKMAIKYQIQNTKYYLPIRRLVAIVLVKRAGVVHTAIKVSQKI